MPSSQDESPAPAPKTKQERIRDNQRRSRARRQEYLADLEKRLRESHTLCRDADIQRSAYIDLQRENACLRTLLGLSGVSTDLIDSFIRRNAASSRQQQALDTGSSMRQLKPKLPVPQPRLSTGSSASSRASDDISVQTPVSSSKSPATTASLPKPAMTGNIPQIYAPAPMYPANTTAAPEPASMQPLEEFNWLFDQLPQLSPQPAEKCDTGLCCNEFIVPPNNSNYADDRNSVLCSVAKELLDQYRIPPHEMEGIKIRLASGFSRPGPGRECRVDNHVLFQLLNEINSKYG